MVSWIVWLIVAAVLGVAELVTTTLAFGLIEVAELGWTLPVYTVLALRRVFKNGWLKTLLKALCLAMAYLILALVLWLAVFAYAALEL